MPVDQTTASIVKDKAELLFSKGRYAESLATYEKIKTQGDKDPRIYIRMGDIARKINDNEAAIKYYRDAVRSFVRLGFVIKAIAVCKVIISIDPGHEEIQAYLAELYSRSKGGMTQAKEAGPKKAAVAPERPVAPLARPGKVPRTPLFIDMNEEEFLEAVKKIRSIDFKKGDVVFRTGDDGDSIYFVAEGEVEVRGTAKNGKEVPLAGLKQGAVFGEFGFFSDSRRTSDVVATEDSSLLELTRDDLNGIIARHPRVKEVLFEFYKERVADKLLALSDIFRPLSEADRKEVLRRAGLDKFTQGSVIMKEGEKGDTMYLIKHGRVLVWLSAMEGGPRMVTELGEGDFFGEVALATARPRVATVTALTDVELVSFSRLIIKDILQKYPEVKDFLARIIKERVIDVVKARELQTAGAKQAVLT